MEEISDEKIARLREFEKPHRVYWEFSRNSVEDLWYMGLLEAGPMGMNGVGTYQLFRLSQKGAEFLATRPSPALPDAPPPGTSEDTP